MSKNQPTPTPAATQLPAVRTQSTSLALPISNVGELVEIGKLLSASGMFGATNPAAGFIIASTCHQQGISLLEFQRSYHIVEGRPSMRADAMLAEFRKRGGKHKILRNDVEAASIEMEYEGQKLTFTYTMEDAKRIGDCYAGSSKNLKHNWNKRPDDMLWARCISRAVRRLCPEIVAGLYTPEEVADFDDGPRSRTAAAPAPMTAEEAAARAKSITAEDVAEAAQDAEIVPDGGADDFSRCPDGFGEYSGVAWLSFPTEILEAAAVAEGLADGHREVIREELERRIDDGEAEAK